VIGPQHSAIINLGKSMEKHVRAYFGRLLRHQILPHKIVAKQIKAFNKFRLYSEEDQILKLSRITMRFVKTSLVSFCVLNTFITCVGYPACIYGKSMQPEFNSYSRKDASSWRSRFLRMDLDWVWVSCWKARTFSFDRGDIVVFVSPKEPYDYVIKRVIGLEGDTVRSHQNHHLRITVPQGHCWVEGDNWGNSVDSNKYGPISKGLVFGVATHVIWPLNKCRRLTGELPSHLEEGDRVQRGLNNPQPPARYSGVY